MSKLIEKIGNGMTLMGALLIQVASVMTAYITSLEMGSRPLALLTAMVVAGAWLVFDGVAITWSEGEEQ